MRLARGAAASVLMGGLAACGPIPVQQAERNCIDDAISARQPRGEVAVGVGGNGRGVQTVSRVELSVSSDYLMGRDPSDVYNRCVMRQSGQWPTRTLADQPGWNG